MQKCPNVERPIRKNASAPPAACLSVPTSPRRPLDADERRQARGGRRSAEVGASPHPRRGRAGEPLCNAGREGILPDRAAENRPPLAARPDRIEWSRSVWGSDLLRSAADSVASG